MPCWSVFRRHPTKLVHEGDSSESGSMAYAPGCNYQSVSSSDDESAVLYHQTSLQNAQAILSSGGIMRRGPKGFGGCGIYFAVDPEATSCKANHKGVILECVVRLGRTRLVHRAGDWGGRWRQLLYGYDSVALTFLEGGIEYVIFDPSRVVSVKIHKVLPTSTSTGGLSSDASNFVISTAMDPGCGSCSSSSSQSSASGSSSGSSVSGDSSDGGPDEVCSSQVAPHLHEQADSAVQEARSSSSSGRLQPSLHLVQNASTSSSSCLVVEAGYSCSGGCTTSGSKDTTEGASKASDRQGKALGVQQAPSSSPHCSNAGPNLQQQQGRSSSGTSCRCRCLLQQHSHSGCSQAGSEAARRAASVAEHMVVLLEDHMQQATCSKQLAASRPADACRQLVGA